MVNDGACLEPRWR